MGLEASGQGSAVPTFAGEVRFDGLDSVFVKADFLISRAVHLTGTGGLDMFAEARAVL